MAQQRIEFASPQTVTWKGAELDGPYTVDPAAATVTGTFSLLRSDGKRYRSIPFTLQLSLANVETLNDRVLARLAQQTLKLDNLDLVLAGAVTNVQGTPIP